MNTSKHVKQIFLNVALTNIRQLETCSKELGEDVIDKSYLEDLKNQILKEKGKIHER